VIGEREMLTLECTSGKEGSMVAARTVDSLDMGNAEAIAGITQPKYATFS
jgi:hypothetical protein